MVATIEAGLPFYDGLELIIRDTPAPMSQELGLLLSDMKGHDHDKGEGWADVWADAFRGMLRRVPTERVQLFVASATIGLKTGQLDRLLEKAQTEKIDAGKLL